MKIMKRFLLPLLVLISFSPAAQRLLTLDEAIATALKNNYDIQLSKNDSLVATLNYSYRNAAFLPRLNGNINGTFNNNDQRQEFNDGTKRELDDIKSNNYNLGLQLNWTLFDGLKMFATRDKFAEFVKLGELGIKNQVVNTIAAVITNYYSVVRQKQQLKAIEEQMSVNQERVKIAQYKLDIGVGAKPDVLQSKVDLNAQKAAQLTQQTLIAQLREQLNQSMNVTLNTNYDVSDTIPLDMNLVLVDIRDIATKNNPLLLIAEKNIDIANYTLKERIADKYPVLSLNAGYNYQRNNNKATVNPFQPLYSRNIGRNIGFTATIPIFNNFTVKRNIQQAKLDIQYQRLVYENQKSVLDLGVINAYKDYEQQKKALNLEEENILLAKENVSIALEVYRLGASTILQLRDAQQSLENAYNRLIAARFNAKLAETELLRLKGDLVK